MDSSNGNEIGENICFKCKKGWEHGTIIRVMRGFDTLKSASKERGDGLLKDLSKQDFVYAHVKCRQIYINKGDIEASKNRPSASSSSPPKRKLRLDYSTSNFEWNKNCIFCKKEADEKKEKKMPKDRRQTIHYVSNADFQTSMLNLIKDKRDYSNRELHRRLSGEPDLVAVEARYHLNCYQSVRNFITSTSVDKKIHPAVLKVDKAMQQIYEYIENNNDSQFTIQELKDIVTVDHIPDEKTIRSRLLLKYNDDITITSRFGRSTIVCFVKKQHDILTDAWYKERLEDKNEEELRIVRTAAKIIYGHIRSKVYINDEYPASDSMFENINEFIPPQLLNFLNELIVKEKVQNLQNIAFYERKCTSIAHAIVSAVRPKSFVSPLHVSLATTLHRKFGSRKMIDICHNLGFCSSYKEAQMYEASAALQDPIKIKAGTFVQFVSDNSDFNVQTIDSKGTFHNLGSILIITPGSNVETKQPLDRLKKIPTESEIVNKGNTPVLIYPSSAGEGLKKLYVQISTEEYSLRSTSTAARINLFWMYMKYTRNGEYCGWNGLMDMLTNAYEFKKSAVNFLPFINSAPSEYNTLYTAIKTAIKEALSMGMKTCIITFDQPLYIKARDIVSALFSSDQVLVIIRLGGFHTLMSFMGSIGYIMGGSGIKEALTLIYAENTVDHILSGHAYARAVRAHTILQQALTTLIFDNLSKTNQEFSAILNNENNTTMFEMFNIEDIKTNETFQKIVHIFENHLIELENKSKTCKLWITYYRMVSIIKDFIAAERMGDWQLHLKTIELMVPFFHSSGHFPYAKSAQLYLQDMKHLKEEMDTSEFEKFTQEGYFTARRSDKFFAGVFSDQTIEQTLMRAMSVEGGPFKRGVTESIVYKWIKGVIYTKDIIDGIEDFCQVSFKKSYQHTDTRDSRIKRDNADVNKLYEFFMQHNPFSEVDTIMCIATGLTGGEKINCNDAFEIGIKTMEKINGENFKDLKLTLRNKVVPLLAINSKIKLNGEIMPIDPLLLFQRICIMKKSDEELKHYMTFELAPYPLALFDNGGMRKSAKATLYNIFTEININVLGSDQYTYVIDGGMLLHRVKFNLNETFDNICDNILRYLRNNFGNNVIVVFDGYTKDCTKSVERARRSLKNASVDCLFDKDMPLKIAQEKFLSNNRNKSRFITTLREKMAQHSMLSYQHESDADKLIVETALNIHSEHIVIVAEDIDVLVILSALSNREVYFLKMGRGNTTSKVYSSKSLDANYPMCKKNILFLHSFTGCDTTSSFFNKGKITFAKNLESNPLLQTAAREFLKTDQKIENIIAAGITCTVAMYTGSKKPKNNEDINTLRYISFIKASSAKKTSVQLASLVPTLDALIQHFKRVYLQVQSWLGTNLPPENWGWRRQTDVSYLMPITMTQPPAPESLLKMIVCSCKTGCGASCGCRKSGLNCTPACSACNGLSCLNRSPDATKDDEEDSEDNEDDDQTQ